MALVALLGIWVGFKVDVELEKMKSWSDSEYRKREKLFDQISGSRGAYGGDVSVMARP